MHRRGGDFSFENAYLRKTKRQNWNDRVATWALSIEHVCSACVHELARKFFIGAVASTFEEVQGLEIETRFSVDRFFFFFCSSVFIRLIIMFCVNCLALARRFISHRFITCTVVWRLIEMRWRKTSENQLPRSDRCNYERQMTGIDFHVNALANQMASDDAGRLKACANQKASRE